MPRWRQIDPNSATGCTVPISLLAAMIETRAVSGRRAALNESWVYAAFGIDGQDGKVESLLPGQVLARVQHGVMFHGGGDEVPPRRLSEPGGAADRQVSALGAAAGEDHFARLAAQHDRRAIPGLVQQRAGAAAHLVHTRRVAPNVVQERQHGLAHAGVQRRGCVVIEVNSQVVLLLIFILILILILIPIPLPPTPDPEPQPSHLF